MSLGDRKPGRTERICIREAGREEAWGGVEGAWGAGERGRGSRVLKGWRGPVAGGHSLWLPHFSVSLLNSKVWRMWISPVDVRNIRTCRDFFLRMYLSQTDNFARKPDLRCPGELTVLCFFYTFAIKEGRKEGYRKVGESRVGSLRDEIIGAGTGFWVPSRVVMPWGVCKRGLFLACQRHLNLEARKQGTGLA